jgi:hypothetical protein
MIDPEFVPSVPEPTQMERAYALNLMNDILKQSLSANLDEALPDDAKSILYRDDIVRHERAVFQRDDTYLIPEHMLAGDKPRHSMICCPCFMFIFGGMTPTIHRPIT